VLPRSSDEGLARTSHSGLSPHLSLFGSGSASTLRNPSGVAAKVSGRKRTPLGILCAAWFGRDTVKFSGIELDRELLSIWTPVKPF